MAGAAAGAGGRALRAAVAEAVARGEALALVGAPSAYCARLAERAGFRGVYLSGGGVALSSLGVPDLGVTTLADVLEDARRITRACSVPLLVDADTGFGPTALNIARCVQDMEAAGVAGLHLEDQELAKRCGHRPNKRVVAVNEMGARIRAAVEARRDPDFVIMARTDAVASEGVAGAVERCRAYVDAGADAIFAEAVTDLRDYRIFADALPGVPLLANMTEFGKTPLNSRKELAAHGVSIALYPLSAFRAMSKAASGVYATIAETGSQNAAMEALHTREETYEVIDYHKYERQVDAHNVAQSSPGDVQGAGRVA